MCVGCQRIWRHGYVRIRASAPFMALIDFWFGFSCFCSRFPGLGLFIVKNIVKLMGGALRVSATVKVGTCFTVILPCNVVEPANIPATGEGVMERRPTLLLRQRPLL